MLLPILLACSPGPISLPGAQEATPPALSVETATYVAEALATMREHSFHREHLDWTGIRRDAFSAASGAVVPADTYEALRGALAALGDHHSFLQLPDALVELEEQRRAGRPALGVKPGTEIRATPRSRFLARREVEGHAHETAAGVIARVVVPLFGGDDADGFARELQDQVAALDARKPLGWIVDLRGNGGGNMWPMLAGVGPILGEGRVGAFQEPQGITGHWYYRDGRSGVENENGENLWTGATVTAPHKLAVLPLVVVLMDDGTASSGEAVAIAFKGRARTRFIGTPTYGLSSSNAGFTLNDGANLVITVGLDVDRSGTAYADKVLPDETIEGPASASDADPQLGRALEWLREQAR